MVLQWFFCALVTGLVVLVVWLKWSFGYWRRHGVYNPPVGSWIFGNSSGIFLRQEHMGEFWKHMYNHFRGLNLPFGGVYFMTRKFFVPTDPSLIKRILETDFDNFVNHGFYNNEKVDPLSCSLFCMEDNKWRSTRAKLTTTFTMAKIKHMFDNLYQCALSLRDVIHRSSISEQPLEIKEVCSCFTTDCIMNYAFGCYADTLNHPDSDLRRMAKKFCCPTTLQLYRWLVTVVVPPEYLKAFNFRIIDPEVTNFFMNMVRSTIDHREQNDIYRKDFMNLLMQLNNYGKSTDEEIVDDDGQIKETGLNINEISSQAVMFFVAGYETSAALMAFTLYETALNQSIQEKMRREIRRVLAQHGGKVTYEAIKDMTYIDKVISECLRKYPPFTEISRISSQDYHIPGSTVVLEKDTLLAISIWGLHRDNDYFPNPEVFDPERFSEEAVASRPSYTYLPFGGGPRQCIGFRFGVLQSKIGLVTLLNEYQITLHRRTEIPLTFNPKAFLLQADAGIWCNIKKLT